MMADKTNRDAISTKIRALMAKTTANGATEQEALLATLKVAELLEKYNMSLDDVDIQQANCEEIEFVVGKVKAHPVSYLAGAIAELTGTKALIRTNRYQKTKSIVYFGFKHDLQVAGYITEIIYRAMEAQYQLYTKSASYKYSKIHAKTKRQSFMIGMVARLNTRINDMIDQRNNAREQQQTTGTSLIVLKDQLVTEEYSKLYADLQKSYRKPTVRSTTALEAGMHAGNKVDLNQGLTDGTSSNSADF